MAEQPRFTVEVVQNPYLAESARQMHAFLTVALHGGTGAVVTGPAAEILLVDCSSSMEYPPTKIAAARRACAAAVDVLRDGTRFAVISGTTAATPVYPGHGLAEANERTRAEAKKAIAALPAVGGTRIGAWLTAANELFAMLPGAVRHALLLTDGKNQHETRAELDRILAECEGKFVCDARGIGESWEPEELLRIASVLRGEADAVPDDSRLAAEFTRLTAAAMDKVIADLCLRISTMPYSKLRFVKQVYPHEYELTDRCRPVGPRMLELSTGSWSAGQTKEYHLCFDLDLPQELDFEAERQLATVELATVDGVAMPAGPSVIRGQWTHDPELPTRLDPADRHFRTQAELIKAVERAAEAVDADDGTEQVRAWGEAVRLATELGHDEMLSRLSRLVDVVDGPAGEVRLRGRPGRSAVFDALLGARVSTKRPAGGGFTPAVQASAGPPRTCPRCQRTCPPGAKFCPGCRHRFDDVTTGDGHVSGQRDANSGTGSGNGPT